MGGTDIGHMLRIYSDVLRLLGRLKAYLDAIERRDADLARQGRRAGASIALNVREGDALSGGNRRLRHASASGSAHEVGAVLDVAEAYGWLTVDEETRDLLDKVQRTLAKLTRR
jgi:four helix bundle protein